MNGTEKEGEREEKERRACKNKFSWP